MIYLILNLAFLLTLIMFLPRKFGKPSKAWWLTLAIVVGLTAIFDPIIIALGIVAYNPDTLIGLYWFGAPIEDFFYAIYAVIAVPLAWQRIGENHARKTL